MKRRVRVCGGLICGALFFVAGALRAENETERSLAYFKDLALKKNFDIRLAQENVKAKYGLVLQARSTLLPSVTAVGQGVRTDADRLSSFSQKNDWGVDIDVRQKLWTSGKNLALRKRERFVEEAAKESLSSTIQDVFFEVTSRYYGVLLAEAKLKVQEQFSELLKQEWVNEQEKLKAGTVSQFNVLRAEVALANSYEPLIRAKHEVSLAMEELFLVTGCAHDSVGFEGAKQGLTDRLAYQAHTVQLEDVLEQAKQSRSEIAQLKALLAAEQEDVKATRAEYWPEIEVYYRYGAENALSSARWGNRLEGDKYGFAVTWNLFDFQKTSGQMRQNRSLEAMAQIRLEEQFHVIDIEVRKAFFKLKEAEELVEASRKVVKQAEESLRLAESRFQAGSATQLDLLDSQLSLTEARTNEIQALYDYNVAVAKLQRVSGV